MIEYENLYKSNLPFMDDYKKVFNKTLESGWFRAWGTSLGI